MASLSISALLIVLLNSNGAQITDANHIAFLNPFRYRGYYYDSETGFYYLQSRYYDPATGRFINADGLVQTSSGSLLSTNMFAYCENNPVMFVDSNGNLPILTIAGIALLAFALAASSSGCDTAKDIGAEIYDANNDTNLADGLDVIDKVKCVNDLHLLGKQTEESKRTHAKNVVNLGNNKNYKLESIKNVPIIDPKKYKIICQNAYDRLIVLDAAFNYKLTGKIWSDLSPQIQERIISEMICWDRPTWYALTQGTLAHLTSIGWGIVY